MFSCKSKKSRGQDDRNLLENHMTSHILSWIIFTPLIGAFAVLFAPKNATTSIKWIALSTTAVVFGLVLYAMTFFQAGHIGFQMIERAEWIPQFGVQYLLGTDGISFPMVVLTAIISLLACLASFSIKERVKEYLARVDANKKH